VNAPRDEHAEFDELAVGWALHALEPDDEESFAVHLRGCSRCTVTVQTTTGALTEIAGALPEDEPPPALRDRIMGAVAREPQETQDPQEPQQHRPPATPPPAIPPAATPAPSPAPGASTPSWRRGRVLAAAAAVLAVVVGLGVWNVVLQGDRDHQASLAQLYSRAVHDVTRPGVPRAQLTTAAGTPMATVVGGDEKLRVVTVRMPENDTRTSVYVLWGVPKHGPPTAIGTFDVTRDGINDTVVRSTHAGARFPAYAVSHEPGRQAPTRPSAVIASGTVSD
jgi:anti-sigma-K factor RskA